MRRLRMRKLTRSMNAAGSASAIGSLDADRARDIADWEAMRRAVTIYMPLLAAAPAFAGLLIYWVS